MSNMAQADFIRLGSWRLDAFDFSPGNLILLMGVFMLSLFEI